MKLKYDGPLSNFAFNFNLRRYTAAAALTLNTSFTMSVDGAPVLVAAACDRSSLPEGTPYVTIKGVLDVFEISDVVAIANVVVRLEVTEYAGYQRVAGFFEVGRCRSTVSKPELKARLVSVISA